MRRDRFTVAFDEKALKIVEIVSASSNYQDPPNFIRASVSVMADMLDADGRGLSIILRDEPTGREWQYSPHTPGTARPLTRGEAQEIDNVLRPTFSGKRSDLPLGTNAVGDTTEIVPPVVLKDERESRRRTR